jgi:monomeric isocitrate dehydrogenase
MGAWSADSKPEVSMDNGDFMEVKKSVTITES